jgi:hypothetical protein
MSRDTTRVVVIVAALVFGAGAFIYFNQGKWSEATWLVDNHFTSGSAVQLMTMGASYITAWYNAAHGGQTTFAVSGALYNTMGGTAVAPVAAA